MDLNDLFPLLEDAFDAESAWEFVRGIHKTDRFFRFSSFAQTALYVEEQMTRGGLSQVERLPLEADGKTPYGDWVIPRAWDAFSARLEIPGGKVLADYQTTPCSLIMYSAPTVPGGITAEVMRIDDPEHTDPSLVRGKLLYTEKPAKTLAPLAVSGGAYGILTDFFPLYPGVRDSKEQMRGHSRWDNDFIVPINETGLFGFSLSPENGDLVRALLESGPLFLHASVDARFYEGKCETVSGAILGTHPEEPEIFAYGHLYEPGANDNGSGCGVCLETARVLSSLIREGKLPRPRRTIRFVMGYECAGSMGYLHFHPERKALCGLVADMVGTEEIDNTHLCLWHNPLSNWSFTDTLLQKVNSDYMAFRGQNHPYEEKPFTVGSDNICGDPVWEMPTVAMITEPALGYHSSMDTDERIEPEILKRDGIMVGAFLFYAANAGEGEAAKLLVEIKGHRERLVKGCEEKKRTLLDGAFARSIASLIRLLPEEAAPETRTLYTREASAYDPGPLPEMPEAAREAGGDIVPKRLIKGCLTFAGQPQLHASHWQPAWNDSLNLPLFWTDGKRCLWEIAVLSAWEKGRFTEEDANERFAELNGYFRFLEKHGYLSLS